MSSESRIEVGSGAQMATDATSPDIGTVFDDHVAAEFVDMDLDATMATMTDEPVRQPRAR